MDKFAIVLLAGICVLCLFASFDAPTRFETIWTLGFSITAGAIAAGVYYFEYVKT